MNMKVVKRGVESKNPTLFIFNFLDFSNDTTHYKLVLRFNKQRHLEMLETDDVVKAKKYYVEIMQYLNIKI